MSAPLKAIVTGHSRGLGAAIAAELAAAGAEVLAISRRASGAAGLKEVALDLSDSAALADWLGSGALSDFLAGAGEVVLVNNAGMVDPIGPAGSNAPGAVATAVALNVAAPLMLAEAVIAARAGATPLRICHISSGAARNAYAGWSVYCATKAALDHHAACVLADALPEVRIESLAPGVVDTDMQGTIRATPEARFTSRARFVALKEDGALASPAAAGAKIAAHLLSPGFGETIATDIRNL
ncbi:SDR family oxidoreductase [Frigidibacter sp. MR17.24]|uniref:SDR family oxidoreductase n=1 Tax=Frigidibacter sp. MR17.24 TaxID=3127345 RepID=UPI00301313C4